MSWGSKEGKEGGDESRSEVESGSGGWALENEDHVTKVSETRRMGGRKRVKRVPNPPLPSRKSPFVLVIQHPNNLPHPFPLQYDSGLSLDKLSYWLHLGSDAHVNGRIPA